MTARSPRDLSPPTEVSKLSWTPGGQTPRSPMACELQHRPGGDEPCALQQHFSTNFVGQFRTGQVPLVHVMAGSIVEHALLPFFRCDFSAQRRIDHDELSRDTASLGKEGRLLTSG